MSALDQLAAPDDDLVFNVLREHTPPHRLALAGLIKLERHLDIEDARLFTAVLAAMLELQDALDAQNTGRARGDRIPWDPDPLDWPEPRRLGVTWADFFELTVVLRHDEWLASLGFWG